MDLRWLEGFVAVAEELNFRRAAARLHLGQPGLSRLVARLERQVGTTLLDRSTTHVELTPEGEVFLEHARSILTAMETALRQANQGVMASPSQLRVGLSEWVERLVPRLLHTFRCTSPGIGLEVGLVERRSPVEGLLEGRFDVVFCRSIPQDERVDADPLVEEPLVAALPTGHPLDGAGGLDISVLADEPLVMFPRALAPCAHDQIVEMCDRAGFRPHVAHETALLSPMAALVAAGSGIALVPASTAPRFDPVHVSFRPIDAPTPTMPLVLARRHDDASPVIRRLSAVSWAAATTHDGRESADDELEVHSR